MSFPVPWGAYRAGHANNTADILYDFTGKGRNATINVKTGISDTINGSGNGATASIPYFTGTTATEITWPAGSYPSIFTICSITRYNGGTRSRILTSAGVTNNLHGHHGGFSGVAYYDGWKTSSTVQTSYVGQDDWVVMCGTNGSSTPNNILVNGNAVGTASGGTGNIQLSINSNTHNEDSNFAFNHVLIWDTALSIEQMYQISRRFTMYLSTGNIQYPWIYNNSFPIPWGAYRAGDTNNTTTTLYDFTGNGNNAIISGTTNGTSSSGDGATASIPYFTGTTATNITWPTGIISATFTICSITRYNGSDNTKKQRIFDAAGTGADLLHGHYDGKSGIAQYQTFKTAQTSSLTQNNWVVVCGTNSGSTPNNIIVNGVGSGTATGGTGNYTLTINNGNSKVSQSSNFAFNHVLIWDQSLTVAQMYQISQRFVQYLSRGSIQYPWIVYPGFPTPWGAYRAGHESNNSTTLYDFMGNGNNATISGTVEDKIGYTDGANESIPYITGTTTTSITWPIFSVPYTFTICSITRYNGSNKGRILCTTTGNFLHGHFSGRSGVAYYEGEKTAAGLVQSGDVTTDNWVIMCGTNSTDIATPNNIIVNGVASGAINGGNGSYTLSINNNSSSPSQLQPSEFAFNHVLIWDHALTVEQMYQISQRLVSYLHKGSIQYPWLTYTNFGFPVPWGAYRAGHMNNSSSSLYDFTGNGRNATVTNVVNVINNSSISGIPYIYGGTTARIIWPSRSIPSTFTICSITRYNGGNRQRILDSSESNFLHGHYNGNSGCAHYESWKTADAQSTAVVRDNWVVTVGTNSTSIATPNNIIVNGVPSGTANGGAGGYKLSINGNPYSQQSDFAFNHVLIWDQELTVAQMITISDILVKYLSTGDIYYPWEPFNFSTVPPTIPSPWGAYIAGHGKNTTTSLYDYTGNGRNATISGTAITNTSGVGNGAIASIPYFTGTGSTKIVWPSGSIPSTFTICSITRYNETSSGRILDAKGFNFIHGHHSGNSGIAFYENGYKTASTSTLTANNWVVMCGTNDQNVLIPNNILVNGVSSGTANGGVGGSQYKLSINDGAINEPSNFAFHQVLIWDRGLTTEQMQIVSASMMCYLSSGNLYYPWISNLIVKNGSFYEHSYKLLPNDYVYYQPLEVSNVYGGNLPFYKSTGLITSKKVTDLFYPWQFESITENTNIIGLINGNTTEFTTGLPNNGSHCLVVRQYNRVNASLRVFQTLTLFPGTYQLSYRVSRSNISNSYDTNFHKLAVTLSSSNASNVTTTTNIRTESTISVSGFNTIYHNSISITSTNEYSLNFIFTITGSNTTTLTSNTSSIFLTDVLFTKAPLLYYPFNSDVSNYATGTGVTRGALSGDASIVTSSGTDDLTIYPTGKSLRIIKNPNANPRFTVSDPGTLGTTSATGLTFSCWAKFTVFTPLGLPNPRLFQINSNFTGTNGGNNSIAMLFTHSVTGAPFLTAVVSSIEYKPTYNENIITLNDNIWHHYCMVISPINIPCTGSYIIRFYLDGMNVFNQTIATITRNYPSMIFSQFIIGQSTFAADYNYQNQPTFYINDFSFYTRELSIDEISTMYRKIAYTKLSVISKFNYWGLMSYYPFDKDLLNYATGTGISDATETTLNATNSGIQTTDTKLTSGALVLSTQSDRFKIKPHTFFSSGLTISLWLNVDYINTGAASRIFDFGVGQSNNNIILFINAGDALYFHVYNGSTIVLNTLVNYVFDYIWHHYCITIDTNGKVTSYIDGLKTMSTSVNWTWNTYISSCCIGSSNWSGDSVSHTQGKFNSVMVFNRALSPSEIGLIAGATNNAAMNGNFNSFRLNTTSFSGITVLNSIGNSTTFTTDSTVHTSNILSGWEFKGFETSVDSVYLMNGSYTSGTISLSEQQYALVVKSTKTSYLNMKQTVYLTYGLYAFKYKAFYGLSNSTSHKLISRIFKLDGTELVSNPTFTLSSTQFYNNDQTFAVTLSDRYIISFDFISTITAVSTIYLTAVEIVPLSNNAFLTNSSDIGEFIANTEVHSGQGELTSQLVNNFVSAYTFDNTATVTTNSIIQNRPLYMHGPRNPSGYSVNGIDIGYYYQQSSPIDGKYGYCFTLNRSYVREPDTASVKLREYGSPLIWPENTDLGQTTNSLPNVSYWLYYTFNYTGSYYNGTVYLLADNVAVVYLNNKYVTNHRWGSSVVSTSASITLVHGLNYIRVGVANTEIRGANGSFFTAVFVDGAPTPVVVAKTNQNWTWSMCPSAYKLQYVIPSTSLRFNNYLGYDYQSFKITDAEYYVDGYNIYITSTSHDNLLGTILFNLNGLVKYIVVGGGGAGGSSSWSQQGGTGGGGGGVSYGEITVTAGASYSFKVGRGGECSVTSSNVTTTGSLFDSIQESGKPSQFGTFIANGGDGGRGGGNNTNSIGGTGGSGSARVGAGITDTRGGRGGNNNSSDAGNGSIGAGGVSLPFNVNIHNTIYSKLGGGGSGGGNNGVTGGDGGGAGSGYRHPGKFVPYFVNNGSPNTGGGGGGGGAGLSSDAVNNMGGNGGSGVIILNYVPTILTVTATTTLTSPTLPANKFIKEILLVGGGAGGGTGATSMYPGFGGEVKKISNLNISTNNTFNITIGAGGPPGSSGGQTSFSYSTITYTANGGTVATSRTIKIGTMYKNNLYYGGSGGPGDIVYISNDDIDINTPLGGGGGGGGISRYSIYAGIGAPGRNGGGVSVTLLGGAGGTATDSSTGNPGTSSPYGGGGGSGGGNPITESNNTGAAGGAGTGTATGGGGAGSVISAGGGGGGNGGVNTGGGGGGGAKGRDSSGTSGSGGSGVVLIYYE